MDPLKRDVTDEAFVSLLAAYEVLRLLHREVPAQAVTVLLYVASHNNCHKQAIEEDCDLTTASCSRMITFLTGNSRPGVKNSEMNLIESFSDPTNGRRLMLRLTPKGEALTKHIKSLIYG